jgi:hypothetical protein
MLDQELAVLAAAGGLAVVQAAGTDAWASLRQAVAGWFGRGDAGREQAALERLDQAVGELQTTDTDAAERARVSLEIAWRTRIETLLEGMDATERALAAEQLRTLLTRHAPRTDVSLGDEGVAVNGDVNISADHGVAGWHIDTVNFGNPPQPGTLQS